MTVSVSSFTIYHSANAYLGTVLLRRSLAAKVGAVLVRRPIFVPRSRGVLIAELLGGKENRNAGSYNREDCRRWADRHGILFHYPEPEVFAERAARWATYPFDREELPARAYYAADTGRCDALDAALFTAAWVESLDVNEPDTIRWAAQQAGINGGELLAAVAQDQPGQDARAALHAFDAHACPGVPTVVIEGERFFGKDRLDWIEATCDRAKAAQRETSF